MSSVDAKVLFVVKDGRRADAAWLLQLEAGAPVRSAESDVTSLPEADVTFTLTRDDVAGLRSGELPLSVGFMRGQVKTAGDPGTVLAVLRALDSPELEGTRSGVLAG